MSLKTWPLRCGRHLSGIHLAVSILVLTMALGWWVDRRNDQMHQQHREVSTGLERMVRLNYSLTNSLSMALLEHNTLRAASYPSLRAQLDDTMQEVERQTQSLNLAAEVAALRQDQTRLRQVERQALALMGQDEWQAARELLFGEDYRLDLQLYEINSDTVVGALTGELVRRGQRHESLRRLSLVLRLAALGLLLWAGGRYSRRLRTELAEQKRLRDAVALANAELEEKVRQRTAELQSANQSLAALSNTDGLTGLANRRHFDEAWDTEWQRALRQGHPLALIMLDIDHFKAYNDHLGHLAGDDCLKRVAQVLRQEVRRAGELPARYGGEEFMVIVPEVQADEVVALAERIRQAIQDEAMPHTASPVAPVVTASLGVAVTVPRGAQDRLTWIERVDAALYAAKHQGRNRVVLAPLE